MATTCFENIITLTGNCEDATSVSGLTINDLGIDKAELNSIVTADFVDGEALFNRKRDFAITTIENLVYTHFSNYFKANSVLDSQRIGFAQENKTLNAVSANTLKGIWVEICNDTSHVDFNLGEVSLFTSTTGNVSVLVYNVTEGRLLDTLTVACTAGRISTLILNNKIYQSSRRNTQLFICYNATAVANYTTYAMDSQNGRVGCSTCGNRGGKFSPYIYGSGASGASGSAVIYNNLTRTTDTGGLSIQYSVTCNHRQWLCTFVNSLALPILFRTASEIADFAIQNSKQLNRSTIIDMERWRERKASYDEKFTTYFDSVLQNIKMPTDQMCYECRLPYRHAIILP